MHIYSFGSTASKVVGAGGLPRQIRRQTSPHEANHATSTGVWLVSHTKASGKGLLTDAGHAVIARAKADGAWTILDSVEALGTGAKKQVLWSVVSAKGAETRAARINRIVERAELGEPLI